MQDITNSKNTPAAIDRIGRRFRLFHENHTADLRHIQAEMRELITQIEARKRKREEESRSSEDSSSLKQAKDDGSADAQTLLASPDPLRK